MPSTQDIVSKLWNLCHVLRDDGISYHQYVTELTFLLFLKMMEETNRESALPKGYRWNDLKTRSGTDQMTFYRELLDSGAFESYGGFNRINKVFDGKAEELLQNINEELWRPTG